MFDRNRIQMLVGGLMAVALIFGFLAPAAMAQDETVPEDQQTVSQTTTPPPPPAKPKKDAGMFSKGKVRVAFYGGAGNTYGQTYVILGAGVGYYLMNGLEFGIDGEGWVLNDPTIWKVTPQIRYVLWQMNPIHPYAGVFWRQTYVGGNNPDYDSWGARGGIAYRKGGSYLAAGVVYEKFNDYVGYGDDYVIYPEIAFWISF